MTTPGSGVRERVVAYLQLTRPANVVTAWADVIAGAAAAFAVSGAPWSPETAWLVLATTGLYAGGVVLNDVFDAALDARERPERPIPSGRASRTGAAVLGGLLLLVGCAAAAAAGPTAFGVALGIAALVLLYDAWAKHRRVLGPLAMGACRGGNLLLGVSIVPLALVPLSWLALIPVAYIAAITLIAQGEVHGGSRAAGWGSVAALAFVAGAVAGLSAAPVFRLLIAAPFLALWGVRVVGPFVRAAAQPEPARLRTAVRAGVTSLILLDAALAGGFGGWWAGLGVLLLAPLAFGLARLFAVT